MVENNAVVRVYDPNAEAEATIKELQKSRFDMNKLSIVGKDYYAAKNFIGGRDYGGDRMRAWVNLGAFWGGLSVLLVGSAFFIIPGVAPIIVFGPLVSGIVAALAGARMVGGLSALGAGLNHIGIPINSISEFENALKFDNFPSSITQRATTRPMPSAPVRHRSTLIKPEH